MTAGLLSVDEAADYLGCSRRHVERLVADRRIAVTRVAGIKFTVADLDTYIAAQRTPAVDAAPVPSVQTVNRRNRGRRHLAAAGES